MTGVVLHDHNCGMKCYRREIFDEVRLYGELHRFVPVLAAGRGYRVGELVINHRPREYGRSKYGVSRFVKGFLDLLTVKFLTGFGQRPQHLLGTVGLGSFLLGLAGVIYLTIYWILTASVPAVASDAAARTAAAALFRGADAFGRAVDVDGLPGRVVHRLSRARPASLLDRGTAPPPAAAADTNVDPPQDPPLANP